VLIALQMGVLNAVGALKLAILMVWALGKTYRLIYMPTFIRDDPATECIPMTTECTYITDTAKSPIRCLTATLSRCFQLGLSICGLNIDSGISPPVCWDSVMFSWQLKPSRSPYRGMTHMKPRGCGSQR
jgi:hypothetical protein